MTTKPTPNFAKLDPERLREISRKGGLTGASFKARTPEQHAAISSKGGQASTSRPFAQNPGAAKAASLKGVEARRRKAAERKLAVDDRAG